MCFDLDARPPIAPIEGGALDAGELHLTAADGARFRAFAAQPAQPTGAGIIVLPDVRGLHPYYEELALRFAEHGLAALAIDYFGRTASDDDRSGDFEYRSHVTQTTFAGLSADVAAAAAHLRSPARLRSPAGGPAITSLFAVGFCFGGRLAFLTATLGLDLAGVIGFYGVPNDTGRNALPAPVDVADRVASPVLGLFGGADGAIPPDAIAAFDAALSAAGAEHQFEVYAGAPHSFFDRRAAEHAEASTAAWAATLAFVAAHTTSP